MTSSLLLPKEQIKAANVDTNGMYRRKKISKNLFQFSDNFLDTWVSSDGRFFNIMNALRHQLQQIIYAPTVDGFVYLIVVLQSFTKLLELIATSTNIQKPPKGTLSASGIH